MEFLLALLALTGLTLLLLVLLLAVLGLGWLLKRSQRGTIGGAIAEELLQRLDRLEARLERLEGLEVRQAPEGGLVSAGVRPPRVSPAPPPVSASPPAPAPSGAPSRNPSVVKRLEQGIENWTGRLGAAAVVAGVTFLLLHSAYRLEPAQRFLLTLLAAAALAGLSLWLARWPSWRELSEWIRSAAGAIALLACAAAGGLPGLGLQWIDQPLPALAILLLGIGLNLLLAWRSRRQALAAAHVVLSLVPLAIVPPSAMALVLAGAIALIGLGLAQQRRWDGELLSVSGAAALHHWFWYAQTDLPFRNEDLRPVGLAAAVVVFGAGVLVVHGQRARSGSFNLLPLLALLTNWMALALALLAYPAGPVGRALSCVLAALLAAGLAHRAGRGGVAWLQRSEQLIAQVLVISALFSLGPLLANGLLLLLAVLLACLVFLRISSTDADSWWPRISWGLSLGFGVVLALVGLIPAIGPNGSQNATILLLGAGAAAATSVDLKRARPSLGWLSGGLVVSAAVQALAGGWMEWLALAALAAMVVLAKRVRAPGVLAGAQAAGVMVHGLAWLNLLLASPWPAGAVSLRLLPLLLLAGLLLKAAARGRARHAAIVLLAVDLGVAAQLLLAPLSPLLPASVWLLLALPLADLAKRSPARRARTLLLVGAGYLLAVLVVWPVWVLPSTAQLGLMLWRWPLEGLGLAVLLRWWRISRQEPLSAYPGWRQLRPCLLEAVLLTLNLILLWELSPAALTLAWAALALLLINRWANRVLEPRGRLYALPISWLGLLQLVFALRSLRLDGAGWGAGDQLLLGLAVLLQIVFVVVQHRQVPVEAIAVPGAAAGPTALLQRLEGQRLAAIDLPMLAGLALAIYWRFDAGLLTLLWSAQAFLVFCLGAWLRNNPLRHLALAGLGLCLLRLLVIDLARADLGLKGVVFVGVGLLLLAMNALVNRYSDRFG
ncbi:hypothetical protein I1E95_00755 [Synechococcus sp. CBW1107]|uniref:hypothetical protein n=1 Tax=Synechococcus sp. CBW1107 TaxID=2789857 RepID=UPI0018CD1567|nr:hypothetical protein [Synechococcus sp. CBW1107]QPN56772.1 hypothetical protein I1E95_00755 [Synechococcus sp. CBW1107]CAK6696325.1 hypothetical protein BBFGKLBO_02028 [Synechococcus sp. CBW1107]